MRYFLVLVGMLPGLLASCQQSKLYQGKWRAALHRQDGEEVIFQFDLKKTATQWQLEILNASERIPVKQLRVSQDSVNFEMPAFESEFRLRRMADGQLTGSWYKGTAGQIQQWRVTATPGIANRFDAGQGPALYQLSGRWAVTITRANGSLRPAIAEFQQSGQLLTGTFLAPSGDYRYLEGIVSGDQLRLSVFDGAHAYLFKARIADAGTIVDGSFFAGYSGKETWTARAAADAVLPDTGSVPALLPGESQLHFSFPDLDSNLVSLSDARFRNKVVIVQLMGSWCPNCMDETRYLSAYHKANRNKGVEVLALAYEYSTDFARSQRSLRKFQQLYQVEYPMLITGAWVNDSLRTQKTLPQLSPIRVFPTTLFIGKNGRLRYVHQGFYGPGTGEHHLAFKKAFEARVESLLNE